MPRIRDLKDQQLYRTEKDSPDNVFAPLLTRTVDMNVIEEQWDAGIFAPPQPVLPGRAGCCKKGKD